MTDLRSAIRALRLIQEQGEGSRIGAIYDAERNLSHYYRFEQLLDEEDRKKLHEGDGPLDEGYKERKPYYGRYYVVDPENPENSD